MTTETLMTTEAATTTEGQAASQSAAEPSATGAGEGGQTQQQSTEGQNQASDQSADGNTEGGETKTEEKPGAPDQYEFQAPEGKDFSPEVIGAFSEVAKELNLSQADAQKVIDKIAPALAERQANVVEQARTQWAESAKADKEFGGEKLTENLGLAKKALDQFGTPELRELFDKSGLGNHPEIIRAFYRVGKATSEDRVVTGAQAQAAADPAKRLFPNQA